MALLLVCVCFVLTFECLKRESRRSEIDTLLCVCCVYITAPFTKRETLDIGDDAQMVSVTIISFLSYRSMSIQV